MDVLSLRCTRPMGRVLREAIALQYNHMLEVGGERTRSRQPTHSGSDYDCLLT